VSALWCREQPGAYPKLAPGPELPASVSLCASPDVPGVLPVGALREFVQYHVFVGISRVWFYDIGHWDRGEAERNFGREVGDGSMAFTDFTGIANYNIPHSGDVRGVTLKYCTVLYRRSTGLPCITTATALSHCRCKVL